MDAAGDAAYYFRRANQTTSLFKIAIDTRSGAPEAPSALLTGLETDGWLSLSSDGTRLVYARAPFSSNLAVVDAQPAPAGAPRATRWLTHGTAVVERPRVSPDGHTVVFNSGPHASSNLFTVPPTGGTPTQLSFPDSLNLRAVWSTDGAAIGFSSTQEGSGASGAYRRAAGHLNRCRRAT